MPRTRKIKWGGYLAAGLVLAVGLIATPHSANAADIPTPEFRESYKIKNAERAVCRSLSGKYVVFNEDDGGEPGGHGTVLNVEDGSKRRIEMSLDNSWDAYCCFSPDEKTLYAYDEDDLSVNAYDLDSGESTTYRLNDSVIEDGRAASFQLSEDGKSFLFISGLQSIRFCKYNFTKGEIEEEYEVDEDTYGVSSAKVASDDYWMSADGKYGYIGFDSGHTIVTYDLSSQSIANTASFDFDSHDFDVCPVNAVSSGNSLGYDILRGAPISTSKGTVLDNSAVLSKEGKIVNSPAEGWVKGASADGLMAVLRLEGAGSGSKDEYVVYDCISGKQKAKLKRSIGKSFEYGYSTISDDGRYALSGSSLMDLKTGKEVNFGNEDARQTFFASDESLICCISGNDDEMKVSVYKSNITKNPISSLVSKGAGGSFPLNPIGIGLIAVLIVGAGVAVVTVVIRRRNDKRDRALGNQVAAAPFKAPFRLRKANVHRSAQQQGDGISEEPRFCGSCGCPLVPGTNFCPRCGAQVKRP